MVTLAKQRPEASAFGRRLGAQRRKAKLTQAELSARVGMGRNVLARLETSPDANPTLDTLAKLAEAIGCSIVDLVTDTAP